jgi:hypothetical protein
LRRCTGIAPVAEQAKGNAAFPQFLQALGDAGIEGERSWPVVPVGGDQLAFQPRPPDAEIAQGIGEDGVGAAGESLPIAEDPLVEAALVHPGCGGGHGRDVPVGAAHELRVVVEGVVQVEGQSADHVSSSPSGRKQSV